MTIDSVEETRAAPAPEERWQLTFQQTELLVLAAVRGHILLTSPGCANDILWGEFSDHGLMEPADAPDGMSFLHAWKLTDAGKQTIADLSRPPGLSRYRRV